MLLKDDFPQHCRKGAGNELYDAKLTVEMPLAVFGIISFGILFRME